MKQFENSMDGLAAVALGVYLAVVIAQGNLSALLTALKSETGFVEFVVAIWILSQLARIPEAKPVVFPLLAGAGIILAMRIMSTANMSVFADFTAGRTDLLGLATGIFGPQS